MSKARYLGMLAALALLTATAACDSPTAIQGRGTPGVQAARRVVGGGSATTAQVVLVPDPTGLAWADPVTGLPTTTSGPSGVAVSYTLPDGTIVSWIFPAGSTVTTYPETIGGVTYIHIVVTLPDGTIIHFIYDPSRNLIKIYVRATTGSAQPPIGP